MSYDIPDEVKYREKIVFGLDLKQLGYLCLFGFAAIGLVKLLMFVLAIPLVILQNNTVRSVMGFAVAGKVLTR